MSETERRRQAALEWLSYWQGCVSAGDQSWLAVEQARTAIMQVRTSILTNEKRTASPEAHKGASRALSTSVDSDTGTGW